MISKAKIKFVRSLHLKKYRDIEAKYIAEGLKIVKELMLQYWETIVEVYVTPENYSEINGIARNVIINQVDKTDFQKISTLKSPQGVLAVVHKKNTNIPHKINGLNLMLENISDPGNLGTIIRTADWFGIKYIFCSLSSVDCYNPKVIQGTMGAFTRVEVIYTDLTGFIKNNKTGITSYATSLNGSSIYDCPVKQPGILVMGNESTGVSDELLACCNYQVKIPGFGTEITSESLNVSVATGIVCNEFRRRMIYSK